METQHTDKPSRFTKVASALRPVVFVVIILAILQVLFDPLYFARNAITFNLLRVSLAAARARWESQGVTDYDVDVQIGGAMYQCLFFGRVSVRNGQPVKILERQNLLLPTSPLVPGGPPSCPHTVRQMFGMVERDIREANIFEESLDVRFDPVYGFISDYQYRYPARGGLLGPVVDHCCFSYTFSNFNPNTTP